MLGRGPARRGSLPLLCLTAVMIIPGLMMSACGAGKEAQAEVEPAPVPVSTEAAERFFAKTLLASQQALRNQSVHLTLTDEEVTSALALASQFVSFSPSGVLLDRESLPGDGQLPADLDLPEGLEQILPLNENGGGFAESMRLKILEPQVRFTADGHVDVRATGVVGQTERPIHLVLAPRASDGELELDFVEGNLGGLPMPELLFDPIGNLIARMILAGEDYIRVTEITVVQGSLTLSGEWTGENPLE